MNPEIVQNPSNRMKYLSNNGVKVFTLLWVCFSDISVLRYITKVSLCYRKTAMEKAANVSRLFWILTATSSCVFLHRLGFFLRLLSLTHLTWQILTWPRGALISSCALQCVKSFCLTDTSVCPFRSAVDTRYANVPSPVIQCDWAQVNIHRLVWRRQQSWSHEHWESYDHAAISTSFFSE